MPEWIGYVYLGGALIVYVWGVLNIRIPYGRGTSDEIDWGSAFLFAVMWPLLAVLIAFALASGRD